MIKTLFLFAVAILATRRMSKFFTDDIGPMQIFSRLRLFLYNSGEKGDRWYNKLSASLYDGMNCVDCNSVWFVAFASIVLAEDVVQWMVYTCAISMATIYVVEKFEKRGS